MTCCRHCAPRPFSATYASVVLLGNSDTEKAVVDLESRGIVPCINAVCGQCGKLSVLVYDDSYVHSLALWEKLGAYLA